MPSSNLTYGSSSGSTRHAVREEHIEDGFIGKLQSLKYEYRRDIRDRAALEQNFREKFEALNRVNLSDGEFKRLLEDIVTPDVFTAARTLRERNAFTRDDGTPLNYTLVNIKDWCKNTFEVVNQLRINTDYSHHRYDVLILINGVPCVQVELKTLTVNPRRAMEQIVDYKNDPGNGYSKTLLCFLQLFIVSNRTNTYYFANNNTRHFAFNADERFLPIYQFADEANTKINHLDDFAQKFLPKCTLGETISRYMVLVASEQKLLMMRPYQVYAVKAIVDCIHDNSGNGYIWHTTGSGKTLTSFKASTLLKDNPDIEKCLFVVDRKDLDRQTREEFNRFQENCVEENTNTASLVRRLLSDDYADNLFYSTGIPVCILVLKKCKKPDDVLFINAADHFEKGKRQNQLSEAHIAKIIKTYQFREEEARYSRRVEMAEIEKNDFNLNISRYISTAVADAEIDLSATHQQLVSIEADIKAAKAKHNAFLKELGLPLLP